MGSRPRENVYDRRSQAQSNLENLQPELRSCTASCQVVNPASHPVGLKIPRLADVKGARHLEDLEGREDNEGC